RDRPIGEPQPCGRRSRRAHSGRPRRRRRSRGRRAAISPHRTGHMPDHANHDRQSRVMSIDILSVASEIYPLVKTGGLADVVGALPDALSQEGLRIRTLVPGYPGVLSALKTAEEAHAYAEFFGGPARLLAGHAGRLDLFVLDAPHLYARNG